MSKITKEDIKVGLQFTVPNDEDIYTIYKIEYNNCWVNWSGCKDGIDYTIYQVEKLINDNTWTLVQNDLGELIKQDEEDDTYKFVSTIDYDNLRIIYERDHTFYFELSNLIGYLSSTYSDKYEDDKPNAFHPKELLTKDACLFNVSKYLRRFSSIGYTKSGNKQDVLKAIHYLLMVLSNNK